MLKKIIISTLLAAAAFSAQAKESAEVKVPFDIKMGDTLEEALKKGGFTKKSKMLDNVYRINNPEKFGLPSFFAAIKINSTKESGVCEVTVFSENYDAITQSRIAESDFNRLEQYFTEKYGMPFDKDEPSYSNKLMASGVENWRTSWIGESIKDEAGEFAEEMNFVKSPLKYLSLFVHLTLSNKQGAIIVQYTFDNYKQCSQAKLEKEMSGL